MLTNDLRSGQGGGPDYKCRAPGCRGNTQHTDASEPSCEPECGWCKGTGIQQAAWTWLVRCLSAARTYLMTAYSMHCNGTGDPTEVDNARIATQVEAPVYADYLRKPQRYRDESSTRCTFCKGSQHAWYRCTGEVCTSVAQGRAGIGRRTSRSGGFSPDCPNERCYLGKVASPE